MPALLILDGPQAGFVIPLGNGTLVLGRDERLVVQLPLPNISRRHFRIIWNSNEGRHFIEDANSKNGTYLNGDMIAGNYVLTDSDIISAGIGGCHLEYFLDKGKAVSADLAIEQKKIAGQGNIDTETDSM